MRRFALTLLASLVAAAVWLWGALTGNLPPT